MGYPSAKRFLEILDISKFLENRKNIRIIELGDQVLSLKKSDIDHIKKFFILCGFEGR